jgi:hypothetical protein
VILQLDSGEGARGKGVYFPGRRDHVCIFQVEGAIRYGSREDFFSLQKKLFCFGENLFRWLADNRQFIPTEREKEGINPHVIPGEWRAAIEGVVQNRKTTAVS